GTIDADTFARAIAQVTVAAGRDETLPLLTGVRMEIEGDSLTLLATDRYRLAMREVTWSPASPGVSRVALVRARTLADVAKNLTAAGSVELDLAEGGDIIGFEAGGRRTTSLLLEGDYRRCAGCSPSRPAPTPSPPPPNWSMRPNAWRW